MARPIKESVDYFPHYAETGKTLFIVESKFKNDGYAFWFKLLQRLCKAKGHVIDCNNPAEWEYLQAITLVNEDTATGILNLLAELQAIDTELWTHKLIWVQHLVDNFSPIYQNRRQPLPIKPIVSGSNTSGAVVTKTDNTPPAMVSKVKSTQSKVNYSKVNNIIKEIYKEKLPDFINKETWDSFLEMRKKIKASPTEKAIVLIFKELENLKTQGHNPDEVLKQSIMNNWRGVFPLKDKGNGKYKGHLATAVPKPDRTEVIRKSVEKWCGNKVPEV